jgi:hypothetical protein
MGVVMKVRENVKEWMCLNWFIYSCHVLLINNNYVVNPCTFMSGGNVWAYVCMNVNSWLLKKKKNIYNYHLLVDY